MNRVTLNYCFIGKTQQFNFMIEFSVPASERQVNGGDQGRQEHRTVLTNRNMNFIIENTNFEELEC